MKFFVDPDDITSYNCSSSELELRILFWVSAAGKNGNTAARCLQRLLDKFKDLGRTPFSIIKKIPNLSQEMKAAGIGCYSGKAITFLQLAESGLDLKTCSVENLEGIKGIGPKTARCFLIHSRPNQRLAGLDTHILKYLREQGVDAPTSTPTGKKYRELEKEFLKLADKAGKSVADFDLEIWLSYRRKKHD